MSKPKSPWRAIETAPMRFVPQFPQLFVTRCGAVLRYGVVELKQSPLQERLFVTFDGRVFLDQTKELTPIKMANGYVNVRVYENGKRQQFAVHRLVASAFCQGYAPGLHVNHRDGVKHNNIADNLEWVTPAENSRHASITGLTPRGAGSAMAKLTELEALAVLTAIKAGEKKSDIARRLGVTRSAIGHIEKGRRWKHIACRSAGS